MSDLFAKSEKKKIVRTMEKSIHLQLFISIPVMFGILTVYDKLIPWFFGSKFDFISNVIPWFSILVVIIPLGMAISRQYLMPIGDIKKYNFSVMLGAIISVILNLLLLPTIGFFSVVISNIVAEFFVTLIRVVSFLKDTDFKFDIIRIIKYIGCSIFMCIVTRNVTTNLLPVLSTNIIQSLIGGTLYLTLVTLLKCNPLFELLRKK